MLKGLVFSGLAAAYALRTANIVPGDVDALDEWHRERIAQTVADAVREHPEIANAMQEIAEAEAPIDRIEPARRMAVFALNKLPNHSANGIVAEALRAIDGWPSTGLWKLTGTDAYWDHAAFFGKVFSLASTRPALYKSVLEFQKLDSEQDMEALKKVIDLYIKGKREGYEHHAKEQLSASEDIARFYRDPLLVSFRIQDLIKEGGSNGDIRDVLNNLLDADDALKRDLVPLIIAELPSDRQTEVVKLLVEARVKAEKMGADIRELKTLILGNYHYFYDGETDHEKATARIMAGFVDALPFLLRAGDSPGESDVIRDLMGDMYGLRHEDRYEPVTRMAVLAIPKFSEEIAAEIAVTALRAADGWPSNQVWKDEDRYPGVVECFAKIFKQASTRPAVYERIVELQEFDMVERSRVQRLVEEPKALEERLRKNYEEAKRAGGFWNDAPAYIYQICDYRFVVELRVQDMIADHAPSEQFAEVLTRLANDEYPPRRALIPVIMSKLPTEMISAMRDQFIVQKASAIEDEDFDLAKLCKTLQKHCTDALEQQ